MISLAEVTIRVNRLPKSFNDKQKSFGAEKIMFVGVFITSHFLFMILFKLFSVMSQCLHSITNALCPAAANCTLF